MTQVPWQLWLPSCTSTSRDRREFSLLGQEGEGGVGGKARRPPSRLHPQPLHSWKRRDACAGARERGGRGVEKPALTAIM